MLLRLTAYCVFIFGASLALLWVTLELKGAVTNGSDWVWYLALGLVLFPLIVFAISTARARSRAMVGLTAAAGVMVVAMLFTYPNDPAHCTPASDQTASSSDQVEGLADGALLEDSDVTTDSSAAGDCG